MQDNGLIAYERFRNGDDGGLIQIIDTYGDRLLVYLNGFVRDHATAEDLLSETFLKLILKKPRLRGEASFKTYLFAMGRNEALRWLKKKRREVPLEDWAPDRQAADVYETVQSRERHILLQRAMKQIPTAYREALYLVYFEQLSCAQAAAVLRLSSRQTSNLLYRGKQALKLVMEREGVSYEDL